MGRILESLLMIILSIFLIMFSTCYLYFKYMYTFWSRKNVPSLEGKFPFGNVQNMFKRKACFGVCFQDLYKQVKAKSKHAGGVFFISKPLLLVVDPDLVKKILIKEFTSFQNRDVAPTDNDPVSANLVVVGGTQWRHLRTKLTPTFTSGKMKMMFDTIKDCTKDLYGLVKCHVDEKRSIDIKDMFARFTTDVIGSCAFGIECNSIKEPNNEFRKHGKMIFDFGYREAIAWTLSLYPWLLKLINIPITNPKVSKFFTDTLRSVVDYREKNHVHRKDFLDLLIRLKNNQSVLDDDSKNTNENFEYGFTFNDMVAQTFIFFAAGFETTSSTLNFCLFELASNIEIQKKLREEVENKMHEYNNILTYDAIMSMTYMDKILQETLRKYPTVPVLSRNCTKDFHLNEINHTVRKGDGIVISTLGVHRDPMHYPEPDKFDPERFSEEEKSKRHPYIYLPFGEGPRMCIGMRFALLQMKLVLSELISNFEFTLDLNTVTPIIFKPDVAFLEPLNTIWIQAQIIEKEKNV